MAFFVLNLPDGMVPTFEEIREVKPHQLLNVANRGRQRPYEASLQGGLLR